MSADMSVGSAQGSSALQQPYQEKCDSLKILVKELKEQLDEYKIVCRGSETIAKCLGEARLEVFGLNKELQKRDSALKILQQRLAQHDLDSEVNIEETEFILPAISHDTLRLLTEENMKLRQSLKYLPLDAVKLDALHNQITDLKKQLEVKDEECTRVKKDLANLQQTLQASDVVKDRTIAELHSQRDQLRIEKKQHMLLCHILTEEIKKLVLHLKTISGTEKDDLKTIMEDAKANSDEHVQKVVDAMNKLAIQEQEYKVKLDKLQEMNINWQRYNEANQKKISELQQVLQGIVGSEGKSDFEKQKAVLTAEKEKLMQDNCALNNKCADMENQLEQLAKELTALQCENQQLKDTPNVENDLMAALKQQIEINNEDFGRERADHEMVQRELAAARQECELYKLQLQQFQDGALQQLTMNRLSSMDRHQQRYVATQQLQPGSANEGSDFPCEGQDTVDDPPPVPPPRSRVSAYHGPIGRPIFRDFSNGGYDNQSTSSGPSVYNQISPMSHAPAIAAGGRSKTNKLQCPKCNSIFYDHFDFMEHVEKCC